MVRMPASCRRGVSEFPRAGRRSDQRSTRTNSRSHSQANSPPSRAVPRPLPARADMRPSSTCNSNVVTRSDLASEPGGVEPAEQREAGRRTARRAARPTRRPGRWPRTSAPPATSGGPGSGRRRTTRRRSAPAPGRRDTGLHRDELVDEQEWRPVGQDVGRRRERAHEPTASSSLTAVSLGLILYQTCSRRPSVPTRNADRTMPMETLP